MIIKRDGAPRAESLSFCLIYGDNMTGKIVVIGAGAAGVMAALTAAQKNKVILIEKNDRIGKKLFITGKGRCNVTNAYDADGFFNSVVTNSKFMYSSFYTFDNNMIMDYLEKAGCPLKIERGGRVFPTSDHSSDVIGAFKTLINRNKNISLYLNTKGISIKSQEEIELMREAGRILAITHEEMRKALKPGMTTYDIDKLGEEVIRSYHCEPSFLNYQGYPASVCVSVNDEVVHGIPSKNRVLQDGDIVSLDAGVIYKGYHSDSARTYGVGEISDMAKYLIEATKQSFFEGLSAARAGNHVRDIGIAVESYADECGLGVVVDLVGHGVGKNLHEEPEVPNFATRRRGPKLKAGMTIAIEPMITLGDYEVKWMPDGWTVVTADKSLAAHYENTILITDGEPEILSRADGIEL